MVRLVVFLIAIAAAATGLSWLADRPGSLVINWQGYEIETSVFRAVVMLAFVIGLAIMIWSLMMALWRSPASIGMFFNRRRQVRGLEALSGGMIAIGAGDKDSAMRFAVQARKALPNEPLTHLLRAQTAQLNGDRSTARRMFESMLAQPETEQLGLRGLYLEAEREGEREAARQFAERSVELNPKLGWAIDALFDHQCKDSDWAGALRTLGVAKKHQLHDKAWLDRRRAVVMTARALALEESDPNRAMGLAVEAHHLAHDLIPAGALAGRMLAARGQTKRAAKIVERAWRMQPHPDLAVVYAHLRIGDSPTDRLDRVKKLAQLNAHSIETPIAIATAAIDAKDWNLARSVLERLDTGRTTQRVCMLMARIEGEQHSDKGRSREWLARAVHAPRDSAWVADSVVSDKWAPVSPVTGAFDAFQWRVPADALDAADTEVLAARLEELVKLSAPSADSLRPRAEKTVEASQPAVLRPVIAAAREAEDADVVSPTGRIEAVAARPVRVEPSDRAGQSHVGKSSTVEVVTGAAVVSGRRGNAAVDGDGKADVRVVPVRPVEAAGNADVSQARMGEKKPLEPDAFIAPRGTEEAAASGDSSGAERTTPRVVASGQR